MEQVPGRRGHAAQRRRTEPLNKQRQLKVVDFHPGHLIGVVNIRYVTNATWIGPEPMSVRERRWQKD